MGTKSVLVVDDSAVSRMVLSRALTDEGYSVNAAPGGREAMDWIEQNPVVDLVITDFHMPGMDGLELVKRLRDRAGYRSKPIFVLTAGADDAEKQSMRQAGATGWIVKPFDRIKLVAAIERVAN